ncbi:MAG: MlaA family lipoprotein [Gammaproteobacteria bacterium]
MSMNLIEKVLKPAVSVSLLGLLLLAGGCASAPERASTEAAPDPLEDVNRVFYGFTDLADRTFIGPAASIYTEVVPSPVRSGVTNFLDNAGYLNVVINDLLQGKLDQGASDGARFLLNTTIGILGVLDVATGMGFEKHDEDLGQTLGVWGMGEGAYLFVPLRGPSSIRDVPDIPFSMVTNLLYYADSSVSVPLAVLNVIDKRAQLETALKVRDQAALDPYIFTREAYRQNRQYEIYDGNPPEPAFEDDLDAELEAELNAKKQ